MIFCVSLIIAVLYAVTLGKLGGVTAGALTAFALFAFRVATYPISPESMGMRRERERLGRQVAALVLICAVFGLAIAEALR